MSLKVISKLSFVDWHVLRENWYEAYMPVFSHFFLEATTTWCFGASRCQMTYLRWRVCKLDLTGLSRDLFVASIDCRWRDRKHVHGLSSILHRMREVVLGP